MGKMLFLLLSVACIAGCSVAPKPLTLLNEEWVLQPTKADDSLREDEQFLKKAQQDSAETGTAVARGRRGSLLKP